MTQHKNGYYKSAKPYSRGSAKWIELDDRRFFARSSWEANYGRYLQFLKANGQILEWEHEKETFWFLEVQRGCRSYLPDFRVTFPDYRVEYHEVKGWMDAKSVTKIKRMAKYYPKVVLIVRDKHWFKANAKTLSKIVPCWEMRAKLPPSSKSSPAPTPSSPSSSKYDGLRIMSWVGSLHVVRLERIGHRILRPATPSDIRNIRPL